MDTSDAAAVDRLSPVDLANLVAAGGIHEQGTQCPAWMEAAERQCNKPATDGLLCKRHHGVAVKRAHKLLDTIRQDRVKDAQRQAERDARAARELPALRKRLERVEAEIARRDPAPPTTDLAAYGGRGSTTATRYRARLLSDANVEALARLYPERDELRVKVAHAERAQGGHSTWG